MISIPLLAVSKEIWTIGILIGSIFLILLLMEIQICQLRLRVKTSEKGCPSATDDLLSAEGVAITTLGPSGIANIKGDEVVVISEGETISKNTRIKVTDVKGNRIVVKPA